jgi:hypothetical protein
MTKLLKQRIILSIELRRLEENIKEYSEAMLLKNLFKKIEGRSK